MDKSSKILHESLYIPNIILFNLVNVNLFVESAEKELSITYLMNLTKVENPRINIVSIVNVSLYSMTMSTDS